MPFKIIRDDITRVTANAIVNTANPDPVFAAGTDSAIYEAAGKKELLKERGKIGKIKPGEAAATPAFRLKAKYIIHTVGPVWQDGSHGEFETLASCYRKSLMLAKILKCRSIAFPLISTGVYGFPKDKALNIALSEFRTFLDGEEDEEEMDITLVVYDRRALELSSNLVESVEQYIDENYVKEHRSKDRRGKAGKSRRNVREEDEAQFSFSPRIGRVFSSALKDTSSEINEDAEDKWVSEEAVQKAYERPAATDFKVGGGRSLQDVVNNVGETFQQMLLRLIDDRGLSDPEVYKGANIDRKLFSKIRCNVDYHPAKKTVLALSVALHLSMDETVDLLSRAGFALSPGNKADLIVGFCIENQIYDILEIDTMLFKYGEPTLG